MRKCLQQELKLRPADPELALVHLMDAPREHLERVLAAKDASRPAPKGFHHRVAVEDIEKHHCTDAGDGYPQVSEEVKPTARLSLQLLADDRDVRLESFSNDESRVGVSIRDRK
jgi:hypothetical protein